MTLLHNYGTLLLEEGDYDGARSAYQDALSIHRNHTFSVVKLGQVRGPPIGYDLVSRMANGSRSQW